MTAETQHDDMALPEGRTCGDCVHCKRCCAIFGHVPEDTRCDWSPSRYQEAATLPTQREVADQIHNLETRLAEAEANVKLLEGANAEHVAHVEMLEGAMRENEAECDATEQAAEDVQRHADGRVRDLEARLAAAEAELTIAVEAGQSMDDDIHAMERQRDEAQGQLAALVEAAAKVREMLAQHCYGGIDVMFDNALEQEACADCAKILTDLTSAASAHDAAVRREGRDKARRIAMMALAFKEVIDVSGIVMGQGEATRVVLEEARALAEAPAEDGGES